MFFFDPKYDIDPYFSRHVVSFFLMTSLLDRLDGEPYLSTLVSIVF